VFSLGRRWEANHGRPTDVRDRGSQPGRAKAAQTGYAPTWDRIVYRGDRDKREVIVFWMNEGRVVAGMNMNVWDVNDQIAALVASRRPVDPEQLADQTVDLGALAGSVG
jgi:3-phenylpropionate/trans-cinnamate dioxygenase ferredoxin reductase component